MLRRKVELSPKVEAELATLKEQFTYTELRLLTFELLDHLSPELDPDEAAPVRYPREAPGFSG